MVISLGVLPHADGSAAIRQGNTWVLASVSGPHDERGGGGGGGAGGSGGGTTTTATGVPQGAHTEDAGLVRCTVTTARFSTPAGRKPSVRSGGDIADAVASTFTAVALTGLFGRSIVDVHVQVLVDDGCVRSAAINATAAALADAGVAMTDLVAGCGVAFVGGVALVDPTAAETGGGEGGGADGGRGGGQRGCGQRRRGRQDGQCGCARRGARRRERGGGAGGVCDEGSAAEVHSGLDRRAGARCFLRRGGSWGPGKRRGPHPAAVIEDVSPKS